MIIIHKNKWISFEKFENKTGYVAKSRRKKLARFKKPQLKKLGPLFLHIF